MAPAHPPPASRSFKVDHDHIANLTCIILSIVFILLFASGTFFAFKYLARLRAIREDQGLRTSVLPTLLERRARRTRKRASFPATVSALVAQSTLVATSPLRLSVLPANLGPKATIRWSMDFLCRGLERSLSWGKTTIGLFGLAASVSALSIQQSFSGLFGLVASASATSPNSTCLQPDSGALPSAGFRRMRNARVRELLTSLGKRIVLPEPEREDEILPQGDEPQPSNDTVADDHDPCNPEPDIVLADDVEIPQILLSAEDACLDISTHTVPLIIASLSSSAPASEDKPLPIPLNENFLNPDGTFRTTRPPPEVVTEKYVLDDTTRLALRSRLRDRPKRLFTMPSPSVLATPGMAHWPRWI
ncbi:hypothetical protein BC834DRAFT_968015 [Gloeopeniophorella convolvens]|nr:hypothetical protein BC834DRAFT_968015 [Gloeopeniophorella convolvens]